MVLSLRAQIVELDCGVSLGNLFNLSELQFSHV